MAAAAERGIHFYVGNWKVVYMLVDDPTPMSMLCTRLIGLSGLNYYIKIQEGRYREICVGVLGQWEEGFVGERKGL